jgi:L-2-hydroxycarboxylate dehydrogenase (NAD+)
MKRIGIEEAKSLAIAFLGKYAMSATHGAMVADHLIYATMAGHDFAGFSRLLPLAERLKTLGPGGEVRVVRETDKSAFIDGAGVNGYVTSVIGMDKAIELARKNGVGIVSVNNSWFSGMLRYYVERAADAGFVAIHAANSTARVAPYGGIDRLLGTNPIAFAFPADETPLVVDFASASLMWGDVIYHHQTGRPLPEGRAVDADGLPTLDPLAALAGAILPWGGPRGYGLSVAVQALGILGGSDPIVGESGTWGYWFMALDPDLLMPAEDFKSRISAMRDAIENSRPAPGVESVRVPGSRGASNVAEGRARGWIEVADEVHDAIERIAKG